MFLEDTVVKPASHNGAYKMSPCIGHGGKWWKGRSGG